jgi:hypothetical protein
VITRAGDSGSQAGSIADYANALLSLPDGVVSAVRTAGGVLKLIAWEVDASGTVQRRGDSGDQAGYASLILLIAGDAVADATGRSVTMITALRTEPQTSAAIAHLRLITWGPSRRRLGVARDRTPGERLPR